jgi:hypothetical protein
LHVIISMGGNFFLAFITLITLFSNIWLVQYFQGKYMNGYRFKILNIWIISVVRSVQLEGRKSIVAWCFVTHRYCAISKVRWMMEMLTFFPKRFLNHGFICMNRESLAVITKKNRLFRIGDELKLP